jgi:hypothetical protein
MPVTPEENQQYFKFVAAKANEFGAFDYKPDTIVWHYTDGPGFLGIIESSTIFATQVAFLNDRNETKYGTDLFKKSLAQVIEEKKDDPVASDFLHKVLEYVRDDNPENPTHGTSKFFVTCFSEVEDDLSQWDRYGGKNGYAIGFYARGLWREPTSTLYKVLYDRTIQEKVSKEIANATVDFFQAGLVGERLQDPEKWAKEFFEAWDEWVYKLAPLAKDSKWRAESEFRLVHELKVQEFGQVRFKQRNTMLGRYIPLDTPSWLKRRKPLLPIAKVMVGPGNHPAFTSVSVRLLLDQIGYENVPVETTKVSLQRV